MNRIDFLIILEESGVYIFYFALVYSIAMLLSSTNNNKKYLFGVKRVPQILRFWIRPKWLYTTFAVRDSARLIGIIYHCLFSFPSIIILIPFFIVLFLDIDLACKIRDIWFAVSINMGFIFLFVLVILEIVRNINVFGKSIRRK